MYGTTTGTGSTGGAKRIAMVTGADKGIGLEMTKQLAQSGYMVIATARDMSSATELTSLQKQHNESVFTFPLDQTDESQIEKLTQDMQERNYYVDLLVLNAGIAEKDHPDVEPHMVDRGELMELLDVNVCGTASVMKHVVPFVTRGTEKKVVAMGTMMASLSMMAKDVPYTSAPYRISKAAEIALVRSWIRDPTAKGVTFLVVHPGHVKTEMGEAGGREAPMSVEDGVRKTLNVISHADHSKSGKFLNYDGTELPF